jgi:hypothetical protein
MSLEMAHEVICPPKKNYLPHFQISGTLIVISGKLVSVCCISEIVLEAAPVAKRNYCVGEAALI